MIVLKVPFKKRFYFREKPIEFLFNIGTMEAATKRLKVDLFEINKVESFDLMLAVLYEGYRSAQKEKRKQDKYSFNHAVVWMEYMSSTEKTKLVAAMQDMMGAFTEKKKEK